MNKRGQITIFMVVGILIILTVGFFIFRGETQKEELLVNYDLIKVPYSSSVENYVQSCLNEVSEKGLLRTGHQGGYYNPPVDYSIVFFDDLLPYYYFDDTSMVIEKDKAEEELKKYVEEKMVECVNDFVLHKEQGYNIYAENPVVQVTYATQTIIELTYPLRISKGQSVTEVSQFIYSTPIKLNKFLTTARKIVEHYKENVGFICLTCLDGWADDENLHIDAYPIYDSSPFENNIILYRLQDGFVSFDNEYFTFEFIIEMISDDDETLNVEELKNHETFIGEKFYLEVKTNKDDVMYTDNTNIFDIDQNGIISFTPQDGQQGIYFVDIKVTDTIGNEVIELLQLKII